MEEKILHEPCQWKRESPQSQFLPRRLVHVGRDGSTLRATLKETGQFKTDVRYVTASHCWGSDPFLTLTLDNYEEFKTAIPLYHPQFSKTFLDILQVAVDLDYYYVWIDSLCIQQGTSGASDWAQECSRMAYIYKYAELNISVAGSIGPGGMLAKRCDLHKACPPHLYLPTRGFHHLFKEDHIESQIRSSPLSERGWIIQERFLVRAVISQH
jgi:hypothetical protein